MPTTRKTWKYGWKRDLPDHRDFKLKLKLVENQLIEVKNSFKIMSPNSNNNPIKNAVTEILKL